MSQIEVNKVIPQSGTNVTLGDNGDTFIIPAGVTFQNNGTANGLSSPEVYGFNTNASGNLIVTTTNGGADNITNATYAAFEDEVFAGTGFTFSISNGNLIATI
ncbi:hypothetical protein OAH93_00790 [Flavobacteriales bacterium]|nr:hypothetical protein [Porticoccaceae bacterium]MDB4676159.1 hypothetical protein [Flavobacteriales bacterium]